MSQGNDFANYSEAPNAESGGSEEVWFVAVSSDDIKQMTVDQLDEAFRLGIINGETAVWTEGMEAWAPLGQVADLDGEGSGSDASSAGEAEQFVPDQNAERSQVAAVGSGFGEVTLQSVQRGQPLGPSSVAPVTSSYAPSAGLGHSAGPVPFNVDEEIPPLRQSRRFRPERWALGAAAVIAIGAAAFYSLDSSSVASARTDAPAPAALAARPHEDTARTEPARGEPLGSGSSAQGQAEGEPSEGRAAAVEDEPSALAGAATAAAGAVAAKAATSGKVDDAEETPSSSKASSSETDSLKGDFAKAINKKSASKTKAKPRKARRAGTKARAARSRAAKPRAAKKPSVPRSQSAFDPLNDSLP